MKRSISNAFVGLTAAAGAAFAAQAAKAAPDLVIQASDSVVEFVGCERNQPLARGRIVIRNEGSSDANLRSAEDFFRSFMAVYVPENIDLIDKDTKRSKVEPGEQRAITFSIGEGKVKKGRNYNALGAGSTSGGFPSEDGWLKNPDDYEAQIIAVQSFLASRGYNLGSTGANKDGADGRWGPASTRALRSFQSVQKGLKATGEWDEATGQRISELTGGGSVKTVIENEKNDKGETKITIFAVVDPYNLIDEEEEKNNIWVQTGYVKCD